MLRTILINFLSIFSTVIPLLVSVGFFTLLERKMLAGMQKRKALM